MGRDKHLYLTCSDDCSYREALNASLCISQDVFSLSKRYRSVLTAEALSFVNTDEHDSSIYVTHVYVKAHITDTD